VTLRGFLLLVLLSLSTFSSAAALRLSGNEDRIPLAEYLESYEDISAAMDIEAVAGTDDFTPARPNLLHPGITQSAIWLKLDIANASDAPLTRWVAFHSAQLQEVSLYFRQQGHWRRMDAGTLQPFKLRPIAALGAVFPLQLAAGESGTVYLRVASSTPVAIDIDLWEPLAFREADSFVRLFDGFLLGSLVLTALFALLMFIALRDRAFLPHALGILAFCLHDVGLKGYGFMYLWPEATDWATRSIALFSVLGLCGMLLFVRELLLTHNRLPRWDRLLLALLAAQSVSAASLLFGDNRTWLALYPLLSISIVTAIVITVLQAIRLHFPASRFYLIAFAIVLIGSLARVLAGFGFFSSSSMGEYATPLSVLVSNIFMLAAVVDRVMLARKEKEAAQLALLEAHTTHETQLERTVEERTAELNLALIDARTANQTKSRLLACISHDLRAPLATIINYVHRLNRQADAEALQYQATIERCATHQLELIDDLVEYARAELNQLQLSPLPTYFYAWLDGIAQQGELLAGQYGNQFELEFDSDIAPIIVFDPRRLCQVLLNLLSNAAKFTSNGHIRLRVQAETRPDGQVALAFTVEDSGPGIPQNDRERIFLPFERSESEQQGSGLGLSIAQQIVRGMGGELKVESTLGQGSRFSFRLILNTALESGVRQPMSVIPMVDFFGTGRTVLVADDNEASRNYLQEILHSADFDVVFAADGEEALRLATERHFDAILVDQMMPRMSGWELLQKLRQQSYCSAIILCSAMLPQRPEGFPMGSDFNATLLKPVFAETLLLVMRNLLDQTILELSAGLSTASMRIPEELLATLHDLIDLGSITEIEAWAEKLEKGHPEHTDFACRIQDAVRRIDLKELTMLFDAATSQKHPECFDVADL
jgi:signal transduction histidine kinase/CheY-like chemotaxis protein